MLNITPNHLDRHKTMEAYANAKANILRYQTADDMAVLCADDPGALGLAAMVQGRLRLFSLQQEVEDGAFVREGQIWLRNGQKAAICRWTTSSCAVAHNVLNVLAAVTLADSVGIPSRRWLQAIRTFHRR